jgi:hypothetical protein
MAQDNGIQENTDPDLASPGFADLAEGLDSVEGFADLDDDGAGEGGDVNLAETGFPPIVKKFETQPHNAFNDPAYYKTALSGEGEIAQRVHALVQKYVNCKDPKDRPVFRQQLTTAYWDFMGGVARKASGKIADPKKYLLRFGVIHPTFLKAEDRAFFAKIVVNNELNQPIYYLDEWFRGIANGIIRNSATDEENVSQNSSQVRLTQLLEKANGKRDGARAMLKAKDEERTGLDKALNERVQLLMVHSPLDVFPNVGACYTESQKKIFPEIQELLKQLARADRDLDLSIRDFSEAGEDVKTLQDKVEAEGGVVETDTQAVETEFGTIRQMAKMTIGRQGNHYPILTGEYFHCNPNDVGFRENIIALLARIESIDPEAFCRTHKNQLNRIVPYVVLIPSYGDLGVCWEPFERLNRAASRGRLAVPMYPKNLSVALLAAVGDLRWQVAKEKASYYWMEEGLTGNYYQWFQKMKLKGDVKGYFIQDYITWMTKESEGIQKLDKEIRGVFWRHMPFSTTIKEKLKGRSFVYQELYQRDLNRSMSDGY